MIRIKILQTSGTYWYKTFIDQKLDVMLACRPGGNRNLYFPLHTVHNLSIMDSIYHKHLGDVALGVAILTEDAELVPVDNETFMENLSRMEEYL